MNKESEFLTEEMKEHIEHYGKGVEVLTDNELKQIKYYADRNELYRILFNKKGHLIFNQRYPNLPLQVSLLSLIITLIVYAFIFANM